MLREQIVSERKGTCNLNVRRFLRKGKRMEKMLYNENQSLNPRLEPAETISTT